MNHLATTITYTHLHTTHAPISAWSKTSICNLLSKFRRDKLRHSKPHTHTHTHTHTYTHTPIYAWSKTSISKLSSVHCSLLSKFRCNKLRHSKTHTRANFCLVEDQHLKAVVCPLQPLCRVCQNLTPGRAPVGACTIRTAHNDSHPTISKRVKRLYSQTKDSHHLTAPNNPATGKRET